MFNKFFVKIIFLVLIIILFLFSMFNPFKKKYEVVEVKDFSCEGMTGFTFKYPVFKGWEVSSIDNKGDLCIINLADPIPTQGSAKAQPRIVVKKISTALGDMGIPSTANPHGVYYQETASWVDFYQTNEDSIIRVEPLSIPVVFPQSKLFQTVIDSFRVDSGKIQI